MKSIIILSILCLLIFGCHKSNPVSTPEPQMPMSGKWNAVMSATFISDIQMTMNVTAGSTGALWVRSPEFPDNPWTGLIVDSLVTLKTTTLKETYIINAVLNTTQDSLHGNCFLIYSTQDTANLNFIAWKQSF